MRKQWYYHLCSESKKTFGIIVNKKKKIYHRLNHSHGLCFAVKENLSLNQTKWYFWNERSFVSCLLVMGFQVNRLFKMATPHSKTASKCGLTCAAQNHWNASVWALCFISTFQWYSINVNIEQLCAASFHLLLCNNCTANLWIDVINRNRLIIVI